VKRIVWLSRSFAVLAMVLAGTAQANTADDPAELVSDVAGKISTALQEHEAEYQSDPQLLEELVRQDVMPLMDIDYAARLILGRAGRGATPEQLAAFARTTQDILISRYAKGLLDYRSRNQIEVLPTRGELNDKMTRVRTRVRLQSGDTVPVDYVFHKTPDGWKVFDVIVEGISYVTTYRNQLMPQVEQLGIDEVTARLGSGSLQLTD